MHIKSKIQPLKKMNLVSFNTTTEIMIKGNNILLNSNILEECEVNSFFLKVLFTGFQVFII